ncbi:MAG: NADH-quinone oxidoreductase subunit C [Euryarchaeota archaeon]|nr:NADH-quinone oxidoreductase subunit C [Euryarchaeota archaeon]
MTEVRYLEENTIYTVEQVKDRIAQEFPTEVKFDTKVKPRRLFMSADKEILFKLCTLLKDQLGFDHCSLVSGVDWTDRFQTVYHISSFSNNITVEIVVDLPHDNPEVDSITPLWGGANWHERETYDMFGIIFKGHPNLKRLLLPEDYTFFPLRKDFEVGGL